MAAEDVRVDGVRSYSSPVMGRTINSARDQHFITDSPHGPAEAPGPVEVFLAGISSCGVQQAELIAKELGVPLTKAEVAIEGVRPLANTANFERINLRFELTGPDREQASKLVAGYQAR
ncbi:MAG TPA: OsmC family protein [Chloroflexota bacterium]|nr:OsmC family protein [Chloroflexota bacterium]